VNGTPFHFRHYHIPWDGGTSNVRAGFDSLWIAGVTPALLQLPEIRKIAGETLQQIFEHTLGH
jgi:hypothetical protein